MRVRPVALILGPVLVIAMCAAALFAWTRATYVCVECGMTEDQIRIGHIVLSRDVYDTGESYTDRFTIAQHAHAWHFESCRRTGFFGVECNEQEVGGWFRVLPRLADHEAADVLYREAQALPDRSRLALMDEVNRSVWQDGREKGRWDEAFERWLAQRHK